MERISSKEARQRFAEIIGRAAYGDQSTIITRNDNDFAAVVSIRTLQRLQELEDFIDALHANRALESMGGKNFTPIDEALRKFGLSRDDI